MKYALYDVNDDIVGFYTKDVHGPFYLDEEQTVRNPAIPDDVIEITDIEWRNILANPDEWKVNPAKTGLIPKPAKTPAEEFSGKKDRKIVKLNKRLAEKNRIQALLARDITADIAAAQNANSQAELDAILDD